MTEPTHRPTGPLREIEGAVALVTGANRGLGESFSRLLLEHGAAKVYGAARDPGSITVPGVVPIRLDVTSPTDVAAAAALARDVTLVVNNAGISTGTRALSPDAVEQGRREFETNVFGPLAVAGAFAPVIESNGGGAIVNVLSVLSWFAMPAAAMYSASKSAAWSLTNSLRVELAPRGISVVGVHVGFMATDMAAAVDAPKVSPELVVEATLDALREGRPEVLADDTSRLVRSLLSDELDALYPGATVGAPA